MTAARKDAEARRLLGDLSRGAKVRRIPDLDGEPARFGVFAGPDRLSLPRRKVSAALVEHLASSGAVALVDGEAALTEAGAAALRRPVGKEGAFLAQHRETMQVSVRVDGRHDSVTVNTLESPLSWLRSRRDAEGRPMISASQYEAGSRLARDHHLAGLSPRVTASWEDSGQSGRRRNGGRRPTGPEGAALDARVRVRRALDAVGPELAPLLVDICCHDGGLTDVERQRGWPRRAARVVLLIALDALARHYGLSGRRPADPKPVPAVMKPDVGHGGRRPM